MERTPPTVESLSGTESIELERVLIPERPRSVLFHALWCEKVDRSQAAELAREDAEDLGRKPAACIRRLLGDGEPGSNDPPGVPA